MFWISLPFAMSRIQELRWILSHDLCAWICCCSSSVSYTIIVYAQYDIRAAVGIASKCLFLGLFVFSSHTNSFLFRGWNINYPQFWRPSIIFFFALIRVLNQVWTPPNPRETHFSPDHPSFKTIGGFQFRPIRSRSNRDSTLTVSPSPFQELMDQVSKLIAIMLCQWVQSCNSHVSA